MLNRQFINNFTFLIIVIGMISGSFTLRSNDFDYSLRLLHLKKNMLKVYRDVPTSCLSEYFINECRNESFFAKMEKEYFPLYEKFVNKFYDPQSLNLEHDWEVVRYFSESYVIYAAPSTNISFKEKAFWGSILLNRNYDKIEKIIEVQSKLASAEFALHLMGAVAGIYHRSPNTFKCLEYALNKHPAKTISMIQWFIGKGGTGDIYYSELYEIIEQNTNYLDNVESKQIFELLLHLIIDEAKKNQYNEKITAEKLNTRKIYHILANKGKGHILTIVKDGDTRFISMKQNEDVKNDFVFKITDK